jgi:hypothetical protein
VVFWLSLGLSRCRSGRTRWLISLRCFSGGSLRLDRGKPARVVFPIDRVLLIIAAVAQKVTNRLVGFYRMLCPWLILVVLWVSNCISQTLLIIMNLLIWSSAGVHLNCLATWSNGVELGLGDAVLALDLLSLLVFGTLLLLSELGRFSCLLR